MTLDLLPLSRRALRATDRNSLLWLHDTALARVKEASRQDERRRANRMVELITIELAQRQSRA